MHTHLKGRIFQAQGKSFLVLHEDAATPDAVRVREIGRRRSTESMRVEDVARHLLPLRASARTGD